MPLVEQELPTLPEHLSSPPEVILTNFFAEPTVLLVPITSRDLRFIRIEKIGTMSANFSHSCSLAYLLKYRYTLVFLLIC